MQTNFNSLKICFVAGTLGQGGAERQLYYIIRALKGKGADVRVLSLTKGEFWEERLIALGVPVKWVGENPSKGQRLRQIVCELRKDRPQIVQSQHFYTNLYAIPAARLVRSSEIGAIRNNVLHEVESTGPVFGRLNLRLPRILAANSSAAIRTAVEQGVSRDRLRLLPNVVDTSHFQPALMRPDGPFQILAVGRLVVQKNFPRFLSILAELRNRGAVPFKATVVGSGPLKSALLDRARELGLSQEVVVFQEPASDMAAVYRNADVLVSTSDYEGTPNVVMEAMASGLPVVATRVGGVPEIVQHGETGFICDLNDHHAMIDALMRLGSDPALRSDMGMKARSYITEFRSADRLPDYLAELYRGLAS